MEYIGIAVGIIVLVLGIKMMDSGSEKSESDSQDSLHSQSLYQQPWDTRVNYSKQSEPNNWMYFFGKVCSVLAGFLILIMILFLTGLF